MAPSISTTPKWLSNQRGLEILGYFYDNPLAWLHMGIAYKYLDIRFDARTGNMLISSNKQYQDVLVYLT